MALLADAADGGMQLPFVMASACDSMFSAANPGTIAYPALARAAANLLQVYGNEEQRRLYMKPIIEGRYYGTMCLSEPQAGSSLADIRTQAELQPDGSYRIRGAKMWISAGDHELGENIVHLVLADRRCAAGRARHQPVHRAALARERRWFARRAQRRAPGRGQPQDGPARQRQHLPQVRRGRATARPNWWASRIRASATCST
jgi:hypothetical protein